MTSIDLGYDLLNYIAEQHPEPGSRLPTITELQQSDHLGVSVSKIREQLEVARALGLVEVRSKTGMKLKAYSFTPAVRLSLLYAIASDPHHFESFSQLRNQIEMAFWHTACARLTADDKAAMQQCIDAARAKLNHRYIRIPNAEHRTFHLTVFRHIDNPFVQGLLEAYWDAYDAVEPSRYADLTYHHSVWDYHEKILAAINHDDFETARQLFDEHTRLLRYQQPTSVDGNNHHTPPPPIRPNPHEPR